VLRLIDDLGRTVILPQPPRRVVSLVPSDTYNVVALGAGTRLVGRTTYCEHGDGVATIGGTKDVDVAAVIALAPDLVIANQEENARPALERLAEARVPVLVSLPRTVAAGVAHLARLARALGCEADPAVKELVRRGYALANRVAAPAPGRRAFVPIWMDPVMTINADTYGSDVLAYAGVVNAFGDRIRLYPLAADLGKSAPHDAGGRDVRYPRLTLDEVRARGAELLVLPDEPHAFSADDEAQLTAVLPSARVVRVAGKDLFWYGAWPIEAVDRLAAQLADG
jgi:ABC-type Fe3+-hydroxamate transport system substrate-binding protein